MIELQNLLDDHGIMARVVGVSEGPVTDRFELVMTPGETVNRLLRFSDHLSYYYGRPVRVAPIPNRRLVGVEIPKPSPEIVKLGDVMSSDRLSLSLGRSIDGIVTVPIRSLPHMIIAGATGSGKSVFLNSVITELLIKNTPDQLRLMLIDPKRVELNQYAGIQHLIGDVIDDPELADSALGDMVDVMSDRYKIMRDHGARHAAKLKLPKIVVVIDELADLMMVGRKSVESKIVRIAQLGRASSIHVLAATQRPSADVVTGLIKANMPARLAFRVASGVDSRIILDASGAQSLLGRGDGLYRSPGGDLVRVQAPYVADEEIKRVVDHWAYMGRRG
jgi:S-DNA-T family DNA segregation ATPase FtsK/SpoIIIE